MKSWNNLKYKNLVLLFIIWIITLLVYLPVFDNEFLNWDDARYITANPMIKDLTFQKALSYFTSYYDGHYHPLTMLSLAIDYKLGGLDPWWFHFTNLLLHFINITLVFFFVDSLFKSYLKTSEAHLNSGGSNSKRNHREQEQPAPVYWIIPAVVALLFAIHPANVESVAWLSERKNVLFTAFFMLALIMYIRYINTRSTKLIVLSFLLFVIAVFSKVTAVSLVFTLVIIDYLLGRKLVSKTVILEKIPFLVFTIVFIVIGTFAQRHTWGYNEETGYTFFERIPLAANSLLQYFAKLPIPYNLSGFYPYPAHINGTVPYIYWLSFVPLLLLLAWLLISTKRNNKVVAFGLLFFVVNIIFLIKLVDYPIGNNKMGDRYLYVPGIGVFFIIGWFIYKLFSNTGKIPAVIKAARIPICLLTVGAVTIYASAANIRVKVWENDISLFANVVKSYPQCVLAWNNMGMGKKLKGDKQGALDDFNTALRLDSVNASSLLNRGATLAELGNHKQAVIDFSRLLKQNPRQWDAYLNRGIAYAALKNWQAAISDYNVAITVMPGNVLAITNRGVAKASMGNLDSAIIDFTQAIELNAQYPNSYFNRGNAQARKNNFTQAIADYTKAIEIKPDYFAAYINRADARAFMQDYTGAIKDYNALLTVQPNNKELLYKKGLATLKSGNTEEACQQLCKLQKMGLNVKLPNECNNENIESTKNKKH